MLSVFPRDVLDEIWDLIESVSEGFPNTLTWLPLLLLLVLTNRVVFPIGGLERDLGFICVSF